MSAVPNFDVNNLVGVSFEPLREVIEFLLSQLRDQNGTLQELQAKIEAAPEKEVIDQKFKELDEKNKDYEQRFTLGESAQQETKEQINILHDKIRGLEERLDMQDKGMKAWDERIQAIENNLAKTTDLAEKNSNRLHTHDERLDKLEGKEEEATATLQIVEINLNKLEPRAGSMEKRLASIEQDISSKVKPRFNTYPKKSRMGQVAQEKQEIAQGRAQLVRYEVNCLEIEQMKQEFQEMIDNLKYELSGKLEDRSLADGTTSATLDEDSVKKLMEQFKRELDEQMRAVNKNFNLFKEKVASKDEVLEILSKIKKLEEKTETLSQQEEELRNGQKEVKTLAGENQERSKDNERAIQELRNSLKNLDKKVLDKADESDLEELRSFVNVLSVQNASGKGGAPGKDGATPPLLMPSMGSKDTKKIKEMQQKMSDLEERVGRNNQDIQKLKDVKDKLKQLAGVIDKKAEQESLKKLSSQIEPMVESVSSLTKEVENLKKLVEGQSGSGKLEKLVMEQARKISEIEARTAQHYKMQEAQQRGIKELDIRVNKALNLIAKGNDGNKRNDALSKLGSSSTGVGEVDDEKIKGLLGQVEALSKELQELKDALSKKFENIEIDLNGKLGRDMIEELEKGLMDKLSDLVDGLQKRFADRAETKKALKHLEKEIKNLAGIFFSLHNPDGDDSLIARKPLGGWSCAACEKGLINMQGIPAEFYPWGKMPIRDPADRIARVGQGFSKMLTMFRPERLSSPSHQRHLSQEYQPSPKTYQRYDESTISPSHGRNVSYLDQSPPRARPGGGSTFYRKDIKEQPNQVYIPKSPVRAENYGHNVSVQMSSTQATNDISGGPSINATSVQNTSPTQFPKIK